MISDDPLTTALREITEARTLIESLLLGSESFNYPEAKRALRLLQRKARSLAKLQARYETAARSRDPKLLFIDFNKTQRSPRSTQHPV